MTDSTGQSRHYGEELQDLLDGRLGEPLRSEVAAHVQSCARCRREIDALRWVKSEIPTHLGGAAAPPELPSRVRAALDTTDERQSRPVLSRRKWVAAGLLAAAALVIVIFPRHKLATLPASVAADFRAYKTGAMQLQIQSGDPQIVEAYFARNGIAFPTRVFDLGMMQYHLAGGRVHRLDRRSSALFAYRGPGDVSLICEMYEGRVAELPATEEVREHNSIVFYVHRVQNLTLVFWQEGDVVCVLASDADPQNVVQLAFAKAIRVGPTD